MSYLEVLQGVRNKAEPAAVKRMLARRNATILPLTETITHHDRVEFKQRPGFITAGLW